MNKKFIIPSLAVLTVLIGAVVAVTLFTQTFPSVNRPSPITPNCSSLNAVSPPPIGTAGSFKFDCANAAAFSVPPGPVVGPVTPTFVLPAGYISLSLVTHSNPCPTVPGFVLSPGTTNSFAGGSDWDYCAYVDSGTQALATFNIQWNM